MDDLKKFLDKSLAALYSMWRKDTEKRSASLISKLDELKPKDFPAFPTEITVKIDGVELLKGDKPVAGVDYPIPENGKDYILTEQDKTEIASKITVPIVEKVIEKTEVIKEQPIVTEVTKVTNEIKEVAVTDDGGQIVDKINALDTSEENQIDASHIKNLPKGNSGGRSKAKVGYADLSSQCDGVLKTFTVPLNLGIIGVFSTQAPIIYRPQIDWTEGNGTLALTSEVDAPQTGQTLWIQFLAL